MTGASFPSPADLHAAVFAALNLALNADRPAGEKPVPIRRAFANPAPPPPPADQDVLYFHLIPEGPLPPEETVSGPEALSLFRFAGWRLLLTFYGPRAEELAWKVRSRFFLDGCGNPRPLLRRRGVYPVPHPPAPVLIWEEWEKQHRPRADLILDLRAAVHTELSPDTSGSVTAAPEIRLHQPGTP